MELAKVLGFHDLLLFCFDHGGRNWVKFLVMLVTAFVGAAAAWRWGSALLGCSNVGRPVVHLGTSQKRWRFGSRRMASYVVKACCEDQLVLQHGGIPWSALGLAEPPQLEGGKALLRWKLHVCSAKSQVSDWAVGARNRVEGVLGQLRPVALRTGILAIELQVPPGAPLAAIRMPPLEVLSFAAPFGVCVTHRSDPTTLCPEARETLPRSPISLRTATAYREAWKGLIEVEAVTSAVDEGLGRHLTDVWIDWHSEEGDRLSGSQLFGHFEVKAALLFAHKIKFRSAMLSGEWASSWLCARRHLKDGGQAWLGLGAVVKASFDEKDLIFAEEDDAWQDSGSNLRVTFRVISQSGLPEPGFYILELIPKSLSESCMALALEELPQCRLVQDLVLDDREVRPFKVDEPFLESQSWLMASLNDSQRAAVNFALRQSLAQIQGPPGTGKTMTTAVLATCFAAQNMSKQDRSVLLCTPTNRAADCAAAFVARICRANQEKRLERRSAEGTECAVCLREKPDTITLCSHAFHKSCLAQALQLGSRCPICRRHVKHIDTGLRILRIYGADIEKQEFPVPKRNEHVGLESRKPTEVPQEICPSMVLVWF